MYELVGNLHIDYQMVFGVKIYFHSKDRYVKGIHHTSLPKSVMYASVLCQESLRNVMLSGALNDLDVLSSEIGNVKLNHEFCEKLLFVSGDEFGKYKRQQEISLHSLYGLRYAGGYWTDKLV